MPTMGFDIGGANIKAADSTGQVATENFAMWKTSRRLSETLQRMSRQLASFDLVAVTMTGEMADCFATRAEGVRFIVDATSNAFTNIQTQFYGVDGNWYSSVQADSSPEIIASSNWHALASWLARFTDLPTLMVDVGSTTIDLITIEPGHVCSTSKTDLDRLTSSELVYTGIERSNVVGLIHAVAYEGRHYSLVNEYFASTSDVNIVLGHLPSDNNCDWTCDGRNRSLKNCQQRLARTIGSDADEVPAKLIAAIASATFNRQCDLLADAISKRIDAFRPRLIEQILYTGHGDFLIHNALQRLGMKLPYKTLTEIFNAAIARAAPAYAVAMLASRHDSKQLEQLK